MKLINIKKVYYNKNNIVEALLGINLEINHNGIIVLLGPSGSGKSTLLNILSGQDKIFEGILEITDNIDYITQNFRLFESMSIIDNLYLVSDDKEKIHELLIQFDLKDHAYKKIKKCSNGQKKRVQFIRALLQNPNVLLCDEPTAALDYDNADLLMTQLKSISNHVQIILVTHDIALAEKYADRIITIDNGRITDDKIIKQKEISHNQTRNIHKNYIQTLNAVLLQLKSRKLETLFYLCVAFLLSAGLYVCTQIFNHVNEQSEMQYIWEKGYNQIITQIDKKNQIEGGETSPIYDYIYEDFDVYKDSDIERTINQIDEILAVEMFYDVYRYDNIARTLDINAWQEESFKKDEDWLASGKYSVYTKQPGYFPCLVSKDMIYEDFIRTLQKRFEPNALGKTDVYRGSYINSQGEKIFNKDYHNMEEIQEDINYLFAEYEYRYIFIDENYLKFAFHPYEINNDKELPIIMGSMPKKNNEVVVDYKTAELIRYQYGFVTLEDMIDKEIEVSVPLAMARFMYGDDCQVVNSQLIVSGIVPYSNPEQRQIFFVKDGIKETLLKDIVNEDADLSYTVVNFLLDTDSDFQKVCEEINEIMPVDQNRFMMATNVTDDGKEIKNYQNPKLFIVYGILAITAILLILLIYLILNKKRIRKEKMILSIYGYSRAFESLVRLGILYLVAGTIWFITSSDIIGRLNQIAKSLHFDSMLDVDYFWMIIMLLTSYIIHYIFERILGDLND